MPEPDPLAAADAAYQQARAAVAGYRLKEARERLDEARGHLAAAPGADGFELGLRIRLTESWLTCDDRGLPAALADIRGVLGEAAAAGRVNIRALAHIQSGVLCARAGNFGDALDHLRPAVVLSRSLPVDDRVRLLLNKGTIGSQAGRLEEAAADLGAAAGLAGDLPAYRFMALHNLGFVEYLRGDLPAALRTMAEADALDADVDRAVARHDRARVLMETGLVEEAAGLAGRAVVELRDAGLTDELAEALLDQARCAALGGRVSDAVRLAGEVVDVVAERGEDARALEAAAVRLEARLLGAGESGAELSVAAAALVQGARAAGRPWLADRATALHAVAETRVGAPADAADPETAGCLRRMRRSPYLATRLLAILAQLSLTADPGRRARLLRDAASDTATARAGMASLDLRTAVALHLGPIVGGDLRRAAAGGDGWAALLATERWRAALAGVPSVVTPAEPAQARLWSDLRRLHEDLRTAGSGDARGLRAEAGRIEGELREHYWAGRGRMVRRRREPLSRARLGRATVLSYFWADDTLRLVHLEPARPAGLLRLGNREDVAELVARVIAGASAAAQSPSGPLRAAVLSSLDESLERLDRMLLPETLGAGPVVVVPSGALARLPWGMLPRLRNRDLTLSRSVDAWCSGAVRFEAGPRVAVAAGPGLALAGRECSAVAGLWAGAEEIAAEPAAVTAALATYDVVHIAAHGTHREDNPLFSSLRLHGGSLFAHELEQVPIRASLVVLSACGAGRGRLRPGDEALGLTSSLLAMGVRAVVAPLTDVPDEAAARTMAGFHRRLAAGQDGPGALADASEGLLDRSFAWFGANWSAAPPVAFRPR
ncbi:CHAT domain-containing protein [Arthrobacter sp. KK5.5]|uniref:CHAT domain-containing protein n=1 Tax=Arthrobacter sp. KK5.5 TaxID=3373084 RepID=UPI003EE67FD6